MTGIVADCASELELDDMPAAQRVIGRGLYGHPVLRSTALDALAAIVVETEFTVPFGDSVWVELTEIGRSLAEGDLRAVDELLNGPAD